MQYNKTAGVRNFVMVAKTPATKSMILNHFSYSCLSQYYSCRWCFIEKYLKHRKPDKKNTALDLGKKWHEQVHKYHSFQTYDSELLKPYTDKYPLDYRTKSEVEFLIPLQYHSKPLPLRLYGFMDGITKDGICDLKVGSSNPNCNYDTQIILYSQVYYQCYKKYPIFAFNWVNPKTGKVKTLIHQSDKKRYERLVEEKVLPFFEALEHPDTIKPDSNGYALHLFTDCPFF